MFKGGGGSKSKSCDKCGYAEISIAIPTISVNFGALDRDLRGGVIERQVRI